MKVESIYFVKVEELTKINIGVIMQRRLYKTDYVSLIIIIVVNCRTSMYVLLLYL